MRLYHAFSFLRRYRCVVVDDYITAGSVSSIYTPACFSQVSGVTCSVLNYRPFYFLSASRMLAGAAEPISVVILVYSAR